MNSSTKQRVVYLFGAGATHACVASVGSAHSTLMRELGVAISDGLRKAASDEYPGDQSVGRLVNDVIDENTDIEHVITFLERSASGVHQRFAATVRTVFESVLRKRLGAIEAEQESVPSGLYVALLDMHSLPALGEELGGLITLNYDSFVEHAVERFYGEGPDLGLASGASSNTVRVLKLHGSFDWSDTWPVRVQSGGTLWIPPGIEKGKTRYPFNMLWGMARELLDCDVLRIVGCRLGPNDWDLISMLFAARHTHATGRVCRIELIDSPQRAVELQEAHPYLDVVSILELDHVGPQLIAEFAGGDPRSFESLDASEQQELLQRTDGSNNWFRIWLKQRAEALHVTLGSIDTDAGVFQRLLEESA